MRILTFVLLFLVSASFLSAQTSVEIDAGKIIRQVNPWLYGINTARWDESLFPGPTNEMLLTCDRDAIQKIKTSGITLLKYPGGNDADSYIWNSPDNSASEMDTDEYIALCREVGAEPFITINFNQPAELAAAWVRYCNRERGYNVKLWEVGDEQWGTWAKGHAPPREYAKNYISFVKAMKAVDPTIKVATNVPLGSHPENWTEEVLRAATPYIDMLTYTFFPQKWGNENDDSLLASTGQFRVLARQLRDDVARIVGKAKADSILIVNVGYNSVNHSPGPQTLQIVNALWTADMLGVMAEEGTDIGCYWALHNSFPPRGGDYGYLSSEGSNTPSYSYYVFPMFTSHFGNQVVRASSANLLVSVYAARDGKALRLILINKDSSTAKRVPVALKNFAPKESARAWILDKRRKLEPLADIQNASRTFTLDISPYSITALELLAEDSVLTPTNLARTATASASSFSTIGPDFKPDRAIDGKMYTRWNSAAWTKSNGLEAQSFQLQWEKPQQISEVRIFWGDTYGTVYNLEYSLDGKSWTIAREVSNGEGGTASLKFQPITARFVRINGRQGAKGISAYSIREIEVFGGASR